MKKNEVVVGQRYVMKVSGKLVLVLITNVCQYGGWYGTNTVTNRDVRIRSAQKLRYTEAQWKEMQARIKAAREKELVTCENKAWAHRVHPHYEGSDCINPVKFSTPVPHASQT